MRRASATSGGLLQPPSRGNNEGGWMRERAQVGIERNERGTKMKVSERRRKTDIFFLETGAKERKEWTKMALKFTSKRRWEELEECERRKCERMRRVKDEKGIVQIKYLYFFVYVHKR